MFSRNFNVAMSWVMVCDACQRCAWLFIGFKTVHRDGTSKQREKPHKIEVVRGVMGPPFEMYCGRPMFHFLGSPGAAHRKLFCVILLAGF